NEKKDGWVECDRVIKDCLRDVLDPGVLNHRDAMAIRDRGQSAKLLHRVSDRLLGIFGTRSIGRRRDRLDTRNAVDGFDKSGLIEIDQSQIATFASERLCDAPSYSRCCAGDNCDLVFESHTSHPRDPPFDDYSQ